MGKQLSLNLKKRSKARRKKPAKMHIGQQKRVSVPGGTRTIRKLANGNVRFVKSGTKRKRKARKR